MSNRSTGTAIVMGASIAGMWAARVLSDYFDTVLILDRDDLPTEVSFRSGTPQARQYHVMLLRGLQLMNELFPGMQEELIAAGAVRFDTTGDVSLRLNDRWLEQFSSGQTLLGCSRLLLEAVMRRRLHNLPQIRFIERVEVLGLDMDPTQTAIRGVRIRKLDGELAAPSSERILQADFVIDALGRRSPTPEWLSQLGYKAPEESVVDSFLGYVTRRYRKPESVQQDWPILMIGASPPHDPRSGLIFPEENQTWVVMLAGANKDYPPVDEQGFHDFARSLGPEFYRIVHEGEVISKPYGYRNTNSRWRHYERLERWPDRYVVLGDAFCGFNPIYGQGMTVAALSALAVGDELRKAHKQLKGVSWKSMQAIAHVSEGAWLLATSADMAWPATTGGNKSNSPVDRFARWYVGQLLNATAYDRAVRLAFLDVNQLLKPASSLFAPQIMVRVLRQSVLAMRTAKSETLSEKYEGT